jgi:glutamyl-tRNA reductase
MRLAHSDIIYDPMSFHVLGISHHSAPLEVREKLAFAPERQPEALAELAGQAGVSEAVLVSTCNRTEVYCRADDPAGARAWLCAAAERVGLEVDRYVYVHSGESAVRHAFRVASGLDSMVLGEPQILGQVKQSLRIAEGAGTVGAQLGKLFQQTFAVAKQVRTETALGAQSISMSAAALKLAQNVYGDLSRISLLLIGVGEMVELAATYFVAQRPRSVVVANRTLARGEAFAERFDGSAIPLADLPNRLPEFDVIITGTASTLPILGKGLIESALRARKRRPIFIVDFAVPRDVEAEVATLEDVFLYTVDDLGRLAQQGAESRRGAVDEAETLVARQVAAFRAWQEGRAGVPAIVELRRRVDRYREIELARARGRLAKGDAPTEVLDALSRALANKFLHHPSQSITRAGAAERERLLRALEVLFPEEASESPDSGIDRSTRPKGAA